MLSEQELLGMQHGMPDTVADMQIVAGDVDLNMILEERARELVERVIDGMTLLEQKLLLRE